MSFPVTGRTVAELAEAPACACGAPLGPRNKSGKCRVCSRAVNGAPVPIDFAEHAEHETYAQLQLRYRVGVTTLQRWRRITGIATPFERNKGRPAANRRPMPAGFADDARAMNLAALCERHKASSDTVRRWCTEVGVTPLKMVRKPVVHSVNRAFETKVIERRDMSRAGQAANYLQHYGPVFRCDVIGRALADGFFWRRGSAILTDEEIIERALRNGWQPDSWRKLAA